MTSPVSSWSRRRAAVAAEAEAEKRVAEDAVVAERHAELAEKSDEEILVELGLPDPDSLSIGDDFKGFLSKTVPEHIRKRALRKLWRSNPVLACVDGLNDYDDDYLTGSTGQGAIKTSYQVGKGMLAHLLEVERQKEAKLAETEPEILEDLSERCPEDTPIEISASEDIRSEGGNLPDELETDELTIEDAPKPRRMKFQSEVSSL